MSYAVNSVPILLDCIQELPWYVTMVKVLRSPRRIVGKYKAVLEFHVHAGGCSGTGQVAANERSETCAVVEADALGGDSETPTKKQ
ncbi:hypothetical protein RSAG8_02790, partial [Rhizoctonia solani AG-8 WAC10335]